MRNLQPRPTTTEAASNRWCRRLSDAAARCGGAYKEVGNVRFLAARAAERVAQRLPHSGSQALARRFDPPEIVVSAGPSGAACPLPPVGRR
jgi:hypothetical protein